MKPQIYPDDQARLDVVEWISQQDGVISHWVELKNYMVKEYPEFREWIKQKRKKPVPAQILKFNNRR